MKNSVNEKSSSSNEAQNLGSVSAETLRAAETDGQSGMPPILWEPLESHTIVGAFNPLFSGYSAGRYCTGSPELGWCLYSRDGRGRWNQKTRRIKPPQEGMEPRIVNYHWRWVSTQDTKSSEASYNPERGQRSPASLPKSGGSDKEQGLPERIWFRREQRDCVIWHREPHNSVLYVRADSVSQEEALKGICVYCGKIQHYESLEQKTSKEGEALRIEHIKHCAQRPELKLIAYAEQLREALEKYGEHAPHCNSNTRYYRYNRGTSCDQGRETEHH